MTPIGWFIAALVLTASVALIVGALLSAPKNDRKDRR